MGGKHAKADRPSSLMMLCSQANYLLESSSVFASMGREWGWKLTAGQDSSDTPIYDNGKWYLLDDNFNRTAIERIEDEW